MSALNSAGTGIALRTEVPIFARNEHERPTCVLSQIVGSKMESISVLPPRSIRILAIKVIATPLLPASAQVGLFLGESWIVKVRLHVEASFDLHCIDEAMPATPCREASYPVAFLKARALAIGCTYGECAPTPEWIRRKTAIFGHYVSAESRHWQIHFTAEPSVPDSLIRDNGRCAFS